MHEIRKRSAAAALPWLVLTLAAAGSVYAAGESLARHGVTAGGGTVAAGPIVMQSAVGQAVVGVVASAATVHCAGLRCTTDAVPPPPEYWVYLPTVER